MKRLCSIALGWVSLLAAGAQATEYAPWYGNEFEFEFRPSYNYQTFSRVDTTSAGGVHSFVRRKTNAHLLNLSLSISPWQYINLEVEGLLAETTHQGLRVSHLRATGRYLLMDDLVGDPVSLSAGLSLTGTSEKSRRDIATPYHGSFEGEFHLAMGRELACGATWGSRAWAQLSIGQANVAKPWSRADLALEHNFNDFQQVKLFASSLWGWGSRSLDLSDTFRSYGQIRHRSIDVGLRYSYLVGCYRTLSFEYAYRVYARSAPQGAHSFLIALYYPFAYNINWLPFSINK